MLHQGIIKDWNSSQGRGFIQRDKAGPDISIHSSGFRKKPDQLQNGDRIFFQIEIDSAGKLKAVDAYKAGQHFAPTPELKKPTLSSLPFQRLLSAVVILSILALLGYQALNVFNSTEPSALETELTETAQQDADPSLAHSEWSPAQAEQGPQFQCEGKQHCSEMSSCEEAEFYLEQCPNVLIDGDRDGIPCERQLCSHRVF